ncbi:hypothetical protein [Alkalimonas mucilaginosa]|uniref:O-antigen ligase like membrane protein n=1 Tax=Alkalimonas mucilaginosa TaxID=3057676 RepID=A0ABU7JHJ4_9GAMM|nr:hypothetical protein [Alkalimonas sp. MEB004]MEE2025169.1 hypothetical protein [Alkalimonas sp. MEB004]
MNAVFLLAALSLLLDMLQGVAQSLGLALLPLAQGYKAFLLAAMLWLLRASDGRTLLLMAALVVGFLLGPLFTQWRLQPPLGFTRELTLVVKLLAPWLALLAFYRLTCWQPALALRTLHHLMHGFSLVLLLNFMLGFAGFGYAAYSPMEQIELGSLGSSGFFISANELSALLLILTAFQLHLHWSKGLMPYGTILLLALFCAVQLLTKTALLGVLLLAALIPLLHQTAERRRRYAIGIGIGGLLLLGSSPLWLSPVLQQLGLHQKLLWVWQEKGLLGLLLSSRELYMQQNLQVVAEHFPPWHWLLGVGQAGIALYQKKYFAESDFFDLPLFFGGLALVYALCWFAALLWFSWQARAQVTGRVLIVLNALLFLLAALAGHVLTSGMLWLPWGCWCGWLIAQQPLKRTAS